MSSAVGVPLAAGFMPVRELATLRRALRLEVEETRPLFGSSRRPQRSSSYLANGRRPAQSTPASFNPSLNARLAADPQIV